MAFAATNSTTEPRAWAEGPLKYQLLTWTCISGDTSGTITADKLTTVLHVLMDGGLILSAAPTYATNVVTLAFNDPVATVYGTALVIGK